MKKVFLIMLTVAVMTSCASAPKLLPPDQLVVQKIFEVKKTKSDLYVASMDWIAHSFGSTKAVVEFSDGESGTIIAKGFVKVPYKMNVQMDTHFTMLIEAKENKARMRLDKVYVETRVGAQVGKSDVNNEYSWGQFLSVAETIFASYELKIMEKSSW